MKNSRTEYVQEHGQWKVGDEVEFKADYEGDGVIAAILKRRQLWGPDDFVQFAIRSKSEPNGYRFHREAIFDHDLKCMVVWVYEDRMWK